MLSCVRVCVEHLTEPPLLLNYPPPLVTTPGDNIHTARHIARECGILTEGGIALEGPDFRKMPIHELLPKLPKLQVGRNWVGVWGMCLSAAHCQPQTSRC